MERPYFFILVIHDLKIPNLPGLISHKRFSTYRTFPPTEKSVAWKYMYRGVFHLVKFSGEL